MRKTPISLLRPGMSLAKTVFGPDGQLWLNAGVDLKSSYIASLWRAGIPYVYIFDPLLNDLEVAEVISEETRREAVKVVKDTLQCARTVSGRPSRLLVDSRFTRTVEKMVSEVLDNKDVVLNLADIRDNDDYTFFHSVNVCVMSLLAGTELGLSRTRMEELGVGALLHDMGKIWVDELILKKSGSLTPDEFDIIKKHPAFGYDILSGQRNFSPDSAKIVAQHHERCNGSGYPDQLEKADIHQFARLVMVVDVYDALTSDRPYRLAMKPHEAINMILECENSYDAEMVQLFLKHLAAYPVGTAVRLTNGDLGLVVRNRKGIPLRPVVRIFKDADGFPYQEPFDLDLMDKPDLAVTDVLSETEREIQFPVSA